MLAVLRPSQMVAVVGLLPRRLLLRQFLMVLVLMHTDAGIHECMCSLYVCPSACVFRGVRHVWPRDICGMHV